MADILLFLLGYLFPALLFLWGVATVVTGKFTCPTNRVARGPGAALAAVLLMVAWPLGWGLGDVFNKPLFPEKGERERRWKERDLDLKIRELKRSLLVKPAELPEKVRTEIAQLKKE